jgi:tetratricopeptide (TPR) repeat protein
LVWATTNHLSSLCFVGAIYHIKVNQMMIEATQVPVPKAGLIEKEVGDELFLLDEQEAVTHRLNAREFNIWQLCNGTRDINNIAQEISGTCRLPAQEILDRVCEVVSQFQESGLLGLGVAEGKEVDSIYNQDIPFVLEHNQRLSNSFLWSLQRSFYERQGVNAWRQDIIPHYATTNPFIAKAYAQVIVGYLQDWRSANQKLEPSMPSGQPFYFIELGAGSGRFTYYFLKKFLSLYRRANLESVQFKYVMTDYAEPNLASWRAHPSLKPFVKEGLLDFARFDVGNDQELTLENSGVTLSADTVKNPIVVLANYCFDSFPQDVFLTREGQLHESLITVASRQRESDLAELSLLSRLDLYYNHVAVTTNYYDDPDVDQILADYQQQVPDSAILFPISALRCCQLFQRISTGRLLLLSADYGYIGKDSLLNQEPPQISVYGTANHGYAFSMPVNYHAVGEYFIKQGGQVMFSRQLSARLNVAGFLLGYTPDGYPETCNAFSDSISQFGPDDYLNLRVGITKNCDDLGISQILALLRLGTGDPEIMVACLPTLTKRAQSITDWQKQDLFRLIQLVWEMYFPLRGDVDLPFQLGVLFFELGHFSEALVYFHHSLNLTGRFHDTLYKICLCYYHLDQREEASQYLAEVLTLHTDRERAASEIPLPPDRETVTDGP